jgi:DNA-binding winged helix-turn-helix (wHTH) protein
MNNFGNGLDRARLTIGEAVFEPDTRRLTRAGVDVRLEPKAAAVLSLLAERRGGVVGRETLLDAVWPDGGGSDEALTQAVAQLRRAFGDDARRPRYLETIPKAGYRLVARAANGAEAPPAAAARARWPARRALWPAIIGAALLLGVIAMANGPHGVRHFLRHTLGLGDVAAHR